MEIYWNQCEIYSTLFMTGKNRLISKYLEQTDMMQYKHNLMAVKLFTSIGHCVELLRAV